MRTGRSSVSWLPAAVLAFAANLKTAAFRTRVLGRFLTLSPQLLHFALRKRHFDLTCGVSDCSVAFSRPIVTFVLQTVGGCPLELKLV